MIRNLKFATRAVPIARTSAIQRVGSLRFPTILRPYSSEAAASSELVAALRSEQKIEQESAAETEVEDKEYFGSFLKDNGFKVVQTPGSEEIALVREAGDETVRVFFNITDVINAEPLEEEGVDEEGSEDIDDFESPVRLNIVVERPTGAVGIEAFSQDSSIVVESVIPYESAALATDEGAEADYKRRLVYQGPPFSVLDPSVQGAVQGFLESRKINSDLALFISEYSNYKENQEYIQWLGKVADILE